MDDTNTTPALLRIARCPFCRAAGRKGERGVMMSFVQKRYVFWPCCRATGPECETDDGAGERVHRVAHLAKRGAKRERRDAARWTPPERGALRDAIEGACSTWHTFAAEGSKGSYRAFEAAFVSAMALVYGPDAPASDAGASGKGGA